MHATPRLLIRCLISLKQFGQHIPDTPLVAAISVKTFEADPLKPRRVLVDVCKPTLFSVTG